MLPKTCLALLAVCAAAHAAIIPVDSNYTRSLDGTWRFKLEQSDPTKGDERGKPPAITLPAHPEAFQTGPEAGAWRDIPVPGNWELSGASVVTYWQPDNSIGLYRQWIEVPAAWQGRQILLNFDGVQNAAEVYLNGQPVTVTESAEGRANYHEGGWDPFQVDLTPAVKFGGKNLLAIRVYKNSKSVDMDSGDFFFLGGIHRSVTLFSVPQQHFDGVAFRTHLLPDHRAEVKVVLDVSAPGGTAIVRLEGQPEQRAEITSGHVELTQVVDQPRLWSAEHPNLYGLQVAIQDGAGRETEHWTKRVGIREITIEGGIFYINGARVKLEGICRHDLDPNQGTAVNEDLWRHDLTLMKAANINAIRTSHYPYGSRFYDLCDELGFYVADEMAACWVPTNTDELTPFFKQHAREMVLRDRNHPCVVLWAVGNENSSGKNNRVAADEMRRLDPTRPRLISRLPADEAGVEFDDRHYTRPSRIVEDNQSPRRAKFPMIYLEQPNVWEVENGADYGNLDAWAGIMTRTWDELWKDDHFPGGFLWEWRDRIVRDPFPTHLYHYDAESGLSWVKTKGICDGYGMPRPDYYHVKMTYAQVRLDDQIEKRPDGVVLGVTNRYSFTNLSELDTQWSLLRGGEEIARGQAHLDLAPLSHGKCPLALPAETLAQADRIHLDFNRADGGNVSSFEFPLRAEPAPELAIQALADTVMFPRPNIVTREANGWHYVHRHPGTLVAIHVNGAAETIDQAALLKRALNSVQSIDADVVMADGDGQPSGHVRVDCANGNFAYTLTWTQETKPGKETDVQEIGWAFDLPSGCDQLSWNRQALWTWYPATHVGRPVGTALADTAKVNRFHMTRPDAFDFNSTKYACNWAELTNRSGHGLGVQCAPSDRQQCRGDFGDEGAYRLIVNRWCCPPRDISGGVVNDLYFKLGKGTTVTAAFKVGSI